MAKSHCLLSAAAYGNAACLTSDTRVHSKMASSLVQRNLAARARSSGVASRRNAGEFSGMTSKRRRVQRDHFKMASSLVLRHRHRTLLPSRSHWATSGVMKKQKLVPEQMTHNSKQYRTCLCMNKAPVSIYSGNISTNTAHVWPSKRFCRICQTK